MLHFDLFVRVLVLCCTLHRTLTLYHQRLNILWHEHDLLLVYCLSSINGLLYLLMYCLSSINGLLYLLVYCLSSINGLLYLLVYCLSSINGLLYLLVYCLSSYLWVFVHVQQAWHSKQSKIEYLLFLCTHRD